METHTSNTPVRPPDGLSDTIATLEGLGYYIRPPRAKNRSKARPIDTLTREEVDYLVAEADPRTRHGQRNRALIELLWASGLRIGEALALKPTDLEARGTRVLVIHVPESGKTGARIVPVKVYDGDAQTPLGKELTRWLMMHPRTELLFASKTGNPMHRNSFNHSLQEYAKRAGLGKRVHAHMFRHSFATRLLGEGVPQITVSKLLGHTSIKSTERYIQSGVVEGLINDWMEE